ncbi:amino acid ABC transporter permease [Candidatus Dactylopiibacterium carminicum]|uniref:amino acid ABC transporter permease n=1 Tax=Candidatus Dactylopiibacterium carminicum TaxID=857335 RepID=UPI001CC30965|nr:amino acid ABC transporter permease [Candidatus Dactylopiibacterium carminicum]
MKNILQDRDSLTLIGAMLGLALILGLMSMPLAMLPAPIGPAAEQFSDGALTTIKLTLVSAVIGLVLGVVTAMGKRSHVAPLRWLADFYVWVIRGTPLLLQILFFFLAVPALLQDLNIPLQISEFWTAVIALSLNVGAYNAEVIRAGINAVPHGQIEAARSLGLNPLFTFWDVVLPQAVRISLPPLANNMVALLKDSSLAYAIGVVELSMVSSRVQAESF